MTVFSYSYKYEKTIMCHTNYVNFIKITHEWIELSCYRCPDSGPRATRMPVDADSYVRRQISLQKHASQLPSLSLQCPGGCLSVSDKHQQESISKRYSSEKNLLSTSANELSRFSDEDHEHNRFPSDERELSGYATVSSSDRFGSERSLSDRLPSGERYQLVSERFPLGERPSTSISTDRLLFKAGMQNCQNEKTVVYHPERWEVLLIHYS